MVTPTKDWKTLERNYRKMLKRLPSSGMDGLQLKLWDDLGEIYRSRLNDFKSAAAAFEIAAKLYALDDNGYSLNQPTYDDIRKVIEAQWAQEGVRA